MCQLWIHLWPLKSGFIQKRKFSLVSSKSLLFSLNLSSKSIHFSLSFLKNYVFFSEFFYYIQKSFRTLVYNIMKLKLNNANNVNVKHVLFTCIAHIFVTETSLWSTIYSQGNPLNAGSRNRGILYIMVAWATRTCVINS